jgi:hypothetical protein
VKCEDGKRGATAEAPPVLRKKLRVHRRRPAKLLLSAEDTMHQRGPLDLSPFRWFTALVDSEVIPSVVEPRDPA